MPKVAKIWDLHACIWLARIRTNRQNWVHYFPCKNDLCWALAIAHPDKVLFWGFPRPRMRSPQLIAMTPCLSNSGMKTGKDGAKHFLLPLYKSLQSRSNMSKKWLIIFYVHKCFKGHTAFFGNILKNSTISIMFYHSIHRLAYVASG